MIKYTTIELVNRTWYDDQKQVNKIEFNWDKLHEMAEKGYKIHTLFPDPSGTTLLEMAGESPSETAIHILLDQSLEKIKQMTAFTVDLNHRICDLEKKKWWKF